MNKLFLTLFLIFVTTGCVREINSDTCYILINETDFDIVVEIYNRDNNGDGNRSLREELSTNAQGIFYSKCSSGRGLQEAEFFFKSDSIVVKFDDQRRLISLSQTGIPDTGLFISSFYSLLDGTFTKTFTQQDYDNAEPF